MIPVVELVGLCKSFPGVKALRDVDLTLRPGRVHALVGENGAGKSTLIQMLSGNLSPDSGEIRLAGRPIRFPSPVAARRAGIVTVHQEVDLFPDLTVSENVGLLAGLPSAFIGWLDRREQRRRTASALEAIGQELDPADTAGTLSPAGRQLLEIAAAVSQQARVLILDEPTSSLSAAEAETLFRHVRRFREAGTAILYVSHRLEELFALADDVTVLRDGRHVWSGPIGETSRADLIRRMVGRETAAMTLDRRPKRARTGAPARLRCSNLSAADGSCRGICLEVSAGEILGLYGLVGAGRSEFAQTVFGMRPRSGGQVWIDGREIARHGIAPELAYVPEDRLRQGLARGLSVRVNAVWATLTRLAIGPWLPAWREQAQAAAIIRQMDVRTSSERQLAGTLSGGNQQKIVIGRWLARDPAVLLLDEPTRGVDVGAKAEIHARIRQLADEGRAVILISSDLPEILTHSDRVGVFRDGALVAEFDPATATADAIATAALPQGAPGVHLAAHPTRGRFRAPREAALAILVVALALALQAGSGRFLTRENLQSVSTDAAVLAICAAGAAIVVLAGGVDISLGALMALCAAVAGKLWEHGTPWPAAMLVALLIGAGGGLFNAGLTLAGRVHPIVVTLGTMSVYRGLTRWWMVTDVQIPGVARQTFTDDLLGVPIVVWLGVAMFLWLGAGLRQTIPGRYLYAVGGNPQAATRVGIRRSWVWLGAFGLQGAMAGLAGMLYLGRSGSLQSTAYEEKTLEAIAAAMVGGVAITGGRGTLLGVALGSLLLVTLAPACQFLSVSAYWQRALVGAVLVVAVVLDARWRRSDR